jgi:hypothetical protein
MSREALDALEAWHSTTLALREATPWTAEWVRLRMVAQEQRATYEALVGSSPDAIVDTDRADPDPSTPAAATKANATRS